MESEEPKIKSKQASKRDRTLQSQKLMKSHYSFKSLALTIQKLLCINTPTILSDNSVSIFKNLHAILKEFEPIMMPQVEHRAMQHYILDAIWK